MPNVKSNELSERELDILRLVATGASNKEIAQKLFISLNTVKVHLRNIFGKIGVTSRTEAAMYAVRIGLVETVSTNILSQEELLQDKDNPDFQGSNTSVHSQTSVLPTTGGFLNQYSKYIGLFGGLLLIIIVIGSVYTLRNIIHTYSAAASTPTPRVQWLQLPGLPVPRWGLAVTAYENQIYAIGGENAGGISNIIEKYDPQTNGWTDLTTKPTPVTDIKAAVIGGFIYVPGGKLASGVPTNINEIYDPLTDLWSSGSSLPKPLSAYTMAVFEGRMFVFGGWDGNQVVNNAFVYDYRNDSWTEIPSMPTARSYAGAVVVGGNIYIIGGWDGNHALSINEVFRPDYSGPDSPWKQAPALPSGRYAMSTTNLADIIFVIGGMGSEDNLTTIALSPGDHNWGQLESPIQKDWSFLGAATVGTRLYVLGGKTQEGPSDQMWSYQAIFTIILPIIR